MTFDIIISLLSLIALEVVLGIDNVIFISILAGKLPAEQQKRARRLGLILAAGLRLGLLLIISVILKLDKDLFHIFGQGISGKDIILIIGGLFLIYKSTKEIHHKMEGEIGDQTKKMKAATFGQVLVQILIMDLVFSVDSIITAVGMVQEVWVMYVAVILTVIIMMLAAGSISRFVNEHPAFKILALAFLLMIGVSLVAEGCGVHIPKGYIYFSMAFSLLVDVLQMRLNRKKDPPVKTHEHYREEEVRQPDDVA
jgi:predicted tellurium resistance membrane protein TerC